MDNLAKAKTLTAWQVRDLIAEVECLRKREAGYLSVLADYARTVTRLNAELAEARKRIAEAVPWITILAEETLHDETPHPDDMCERCQLEKLLKEE